MNYAFLRDHDVRSPPVRSHRFFRERQMAVAKGLVAAGKAAAFAFLLVVGSPNVARSQNGNLVFMSGFESETTLDAPSECWQTPSGCWQQIAGVDITTGHVWPPHIWGDSRFNGSGGVFQLIADVPGVTASTIGDYLFNRIVNVQRHTGSLTNQALYSQITTGPNGQNPIGKAATQNSFQLVPAFEGGDLYISYWIKFQPGMTKNMIGLDPAIPGVYPDGGTWRSFFAFKTGTSAAAGGLPGNDGDYRVAAYVLTGCPYEATRPPCPSANPAPFWVVTGDNNAGGGYPLVNDWVATNTAVPVPEDGQWSKVEVYWHRSSGADGRLWMAIDGSVIVDHRGPNTGGASPSPNPINRIMISGLYSGGRLPIYQWVDDVQIWDGGFPTCMSADACWDPPYAPH